MSLILESKRDDRTNFGAILNAPGYRGFFGRMHWLLYGNYLRGLTWKDVGFVTKTVTSTEIIRYLKLGCWQKRKDPFVISFTSTAEHQETRIDEVYGCAEQLMATLHSFKAPVALQYDVGCPNESIHKDANEEELALELIRVFRILRILNIPLILSCNALMPISVIQTLSGYVDALWISNSSPKAFHLTLKKVEEIRRDGIGVPIIAGDTRSPLDVCNLRKAGTNAVFIGSIAVTNPKLMRTVIQMALEYPQSIPIHP